MGTQRILCIGQRQRLIWQRRGLSLYGFSSYGISSYGLLLWLGLLPLFLFVQLAQAAPQANAPSVRGPTSATNALELSLPPQLQPWIPWVKHELADQVCASSTGVPTCVWPGLLRLDLRPGAGKFELRVVLDREAGVTLPGSLEAWPQAVSADGRAGTVLEHDGKPVLWLGTGEHRVQGAFLWTEIPELLAIPAELGRVELALDGAAIALPKRDEQSRLWLRAEGDAAETEQLEIEVFRKLEDGVPPQITTRILLRTAGKPREVDLGNVLVPGSVPLSVTSDAPLRLEQAGGLRVQVRAGVQRVELIARLQRDALELTLPKKAAPWPEREIWVWQPRPELRQVQLSGVQAVDSSRTNLDQDWKALAAYTLTQEGALQLNIERRGLPAPPPNQLQIRREMWLDLGGGGYTVRDHLHGELHQSWRLDLQSGALGRVTAAGVPQLITDSPSAATAGVELRESKLNLVADYRLPAPPGSLNAVGWSEDAEQLVTTLHLPPGWELLAATGVDNTPGTWLSSWNLFSLFFVLIVAVAVARLTGPLGGAAALLGLSLTHARPEAPEWIWVALLGCVALLRVLGRGRFRSFVRLLSVVTLLTLLSLFVSFAVSEVRHALYPQVAHESQTLARAGFDDDGGHDQALSAPTLSDAAGDAAQQFAAQNQLAEPPANGPRAGEAKAGASASRAPEALEQRALGRVKSAMREVGSSNAYDKKQTLLAQAPEAAIQTGPGVPEWSFRSWELQWSGPVARGEAFQLYLASPALNAVLSLLRVLLLGLMLFLLLRTTPWGDAPPAELSLWRWTRKSPTSSASSTSLRVRSGLLLSATIAAGLCFSGPAAAQFPSPELLQELKGRLTPSTTCEPNCLNVSELKLQVQERELSLQIQLHAGRATAYRIPGPAKAWGATSVIIDGQETAALRASDDGFLLLRVPEGRHEVLIEGPLLGNELVLDVGVPKHVSVNAPGWLVDGVRADGRVQGAIQLRRRLNDQAANATDLPALPPWLEITRTLSIGVNWSIETVIKRVSAGGTSLIARFPLLPGEATTSSSLIVEDGNVLLSFGRDDTTLAFSSTLTPRDRLELRAPAGVPWSEVWEVACGVIRHCVASGLDPVRYEAEGETRPLYRPWPGETLVIEFPRPAASAGASVTVDRAELTVTPGTRLEKALLVLSVRSSNGGSQLVTLPATAQVQHLRIDGIEQPPILQDKESYVVSLRPGAQRIELEWQEPGGMALVQETPSVKLNGEAVNVHLHVKLPSERWLLFASGPRWGAAILFWGYLLLVVLAGIVLGRVPASPLKSWQWILLGVGLTQLPSVLSVLVAAWFFALAQRPKFLPAQRIPYNLVQILLAGWTLLVLGTLASAVYSDLVMAPDMQVTGAGSTATELNWYVDRVAGALPQATVYSTSLWVWRLAMLAWALWLAVQVIEWLRWAWQQLTLGGGWRVRPPKAVATKAAVPAEGPDLTP